MTGLDSHARAILNAARDADNPTSLQRERAVQKLALRLGFGASVVASTYGASAAAPLAKVLLTALVVLGGAVGGGLWWHSVQTPSEQAGVLLTPPAPVEAEAPITEPIPNTVAESPRSEAPVTGNAAANQPSLRKGARSPNAAKLNGLEDETALLSRVNSALRAGELTSVTEILNEYDRRFPRGVLREESAASRVVMLCQAKSPGALAKARQFLQAHPASPQVRRVERACLP